MTFKNNKYALILKHTQQFNQQLKVTEMFFFIIGEWQSQCYASLHLDFHEHLLSHAADKKCQSDLHNTNYTCACVESPLFCLFSNCSNSSSTRLLSLYITFYRCCKCATFLFVRTLRNAMKHGIKICLL